MTRWGNLRPTGQCIDENQVVSPYMGPAKSDAIVLMWLVRTTPCGFFGSGAGLVHCDAETLTLLDVDWSTWATKQLLLPLLLQPE